MTAPVFVLAPEQLDAVSPGDVLPLAGDEGKHAATVRRLRAGEEVALVDGHGRRASGQVTEVLGPSALTVTVSEVTTQPPPQPRITVVQALVKGDRADAAVEMLTEVGADEIVPWSADRCVARWRGDKVTRGRQRWATIAVAASKQSRRARFPVVAPLAGLDDVVARIAAADLALVLHEEAALRLAAIVPPRLGEIVLIVGPEGGISDRELTAFVAAGALSVRMGTSVLRTSTAATAAAAVVLSRVGRWD